VHRGGLHVRASRLDELEGAVDMQGVKRAWPAVLGFGAIIVLVSGISATSLADTVELSTGQRIEGTLKQATQQAVVIDVQGKLITFEAALVKAIYFGKTPRAAEAAKGVSAGDAIRALKGLQSAVRVGLPFRDYGPRVIDTRIKVDQYLDTKVGTPNLRQALGRSMMFYEAALSTWEEKVALNDGISLARIDALHVVACGGLKGLTNRVRDNYSSSTDRRGVTVDSSFTGDVLSRIWLCASESIGEAERLGAK
jgi:hypothetical protein